MSVAVKVALPAVLAVTAKVFVPATSAAFAGRVAFASRARDPGRVGDGVDEVPVRVDRVDGDGEAGAGGLSGRRAGLAGGRCRVPRSRRASAAAAW